jgi:hypothetical protein
MDFNPEKEQKVRVPSRKWAKVWKGKKNRTSEGGHAKFKVRISEI